MLIAIALFLIPDKREKELKPFVARIVTPEELQNEERQAGKRPIVRQKDRKSKPDRNGRIVTREKDAPKVLSAVPSSPSAKKSSHGPRALAKELPSRGGQTTPLPDTADQKGYQSSGGAGSGRSPLPGRQQAPMRERLFDRDVIAKLSKKEQAGTKEGSSITFDTAEFKYYGYMQRLKEKIESTWKYPTDAAAKHIYGDLYIQFTIKRNGKLGAVQLVRTSGYKGLDDAALKALKDAEPYWPLPDDIGEESLTITGHFIYSLYGPYIR